MLRRYLLSGLVLLMAASGCGDDRAVESAGGLALAEAPQLEVSARASKSGPGRATKAPAGLVRQLAKVSALVTPPSSPVAITQPTACDFVAPSSNNEDRSGCRAGDAAGGHRVVDRVERLNPFWEDEADDAAAFGWGRRGLGRDMTVLTVGADVYVQRKWGPYTPCSTVGPVDPCGSNLWGEQTWGVDALRRINGKLVLQWQRTSSWTPAGVDALSQQFEPLFQPVIVGSRIFIPEAGGRVSAVNRSTGLVDFVYATPAEDEDDAERTEVMSGLNTRLANGDGAVYWTAIQLQAGNPFNTENSWLVEGRPDGTTRKVEFVSITTPVPSCIHPFFYTIYNSPPFVTPLPWPPAPGVLGPLFGCGVLRPVMNAAPALSLDGKRVYVVARPRQAASHSQIVALHTSTLQRIWGTDFKNWLDDDCGVLTPLTDASNPNEVTDRKCKFGTPAGVHRETGESFAGGMPLDLQVSSPTPTPDGGLFMGTYTPYDNERGHMFRFNADGSILSTFNYGWNQTAAIRRNPIVQLPHEFRAIFGNSHYNNAPFKLEGHDGYYGVAGRWSRTAAGTQTCERSGNIVTCTPAAPLDGSGQANKECYKWSNTSGSGRQCISVTPGGAPFEFLMRQALVTGGGSATTSRNLWVFGSDGFAELRSGHTGNVLERVFVDSSITQEDVPISTDSEGRIYIMFRGNLHVIASRDHAGAAIDGIPMPPPPPPPVPLVN